jgi:hypothetical protein
MYYYNHIEATRWTTEESGARFPTEEKTLPLLYNVHTGSGAHPGRCTMYTGTVSPE